MKVSKRDGLDSACENGRLGEAARRGAMVSVFNLGDFELASGVTLADAQLTYEVHGKLNGARDNAVVFATWYAGRHKEVAGFVREGRALDPAKYFIVVPNTFGNGLSTSPSNAKAPHDGTHFPLVSAYDNVAAQHRLLTDGLGVRGVALVAGYSMSAQQAFHWGALHSGFVRRIAAICGSAKTSPHNWLFLEGLKTALQADPAWQTGGSAGIRAFTTVYAGWLTSQTFYREGLHLKKMARPLPSISAYLDLLTSLFGSFDPRDLMALLATWQDADVSAHPKFSNDVRKALGSITARAVVMPCSTDLYFPPEDSKAAVALMPNATLLPIPSVWGHLAGHPALNPEDAGFVNRALEELLSS